MRERWVSTNESLEMSDRDYFDIFSQALLARGPVKSAPVFIGDPAGVEAGLAIYRNNVRSALTCALGAKFPVVEKLVGDGFFKFLTHEYFHEHPPSSQLIMRYGDVLPEFLEGFEPARNIPYLADVARFEIAWLDAYHAPDADPLATDTVIAAAGDDPGRLRLVLHPSLRLLASPYPVASIWRHNKAHADPPKISVEGSEQVIIVRPSRNVIVSTLSSGEFAAMKRISKGDRIDAAIEAGMEFESSLDPQAVFKALFEHQVIVGVEC